MDANTDAAVDATIPVDRLFLADLLGSSDEALLNEMLQAFRAAAAGAWREVDDAIAMGDVERLLIAAHGAKGEARTAGAGPLAGLYEQLERAARQKDGAAIQALHHPVRREVERVLAFLDAGAVESVA